MDGLSEAGRLTLSSSAAHQAAALLFKNGVGKDLDIEARQCFVPSQSTNTAYKVNLLHFTCECTNFRMGNICKHLLLVKMEVGRRGIDIEKMRNNKALEIISLRLYQQTEDEITIFNSDGTMSIVNRKTPTLCTCIANSFGERCVCIRHTSLKTFSQTPKKMHKCLKPPMGILPYSPCYQTYYSGATPKHLNIPLNCTIPSKEHTSWLLENSLLCTEKGKLPLYMVTVKKLKKLDCREQ